VGRVAAHQQIITCGVAVGELSIEPAPQKFAHDEILAGVAGRYAGLALLDRFDGCRRGGLELHDVHCSGSLLVPSEERTSGSKKTA
jgi:hypothetical protein